MSFSYSEHAPILDVDVEHMHIDIQLRTRAEPFGTGSPQLIEADFLIGDAASPANALPGGEEKELTNRLPPSISTVSNASRKKRRPAPGPRRDMQADLTKPSSGLSISIDLGEQSLSDFDAFAQLNPIPSASSPRQPSAVAKFVQVRRKEIPPAAQSPAFIEALTHLISPVYTSPGMNSSPPGGSSLPGNFGLGISHTDVQGLGISGTSEEEVSTESEAAPYSQPNATKVHYVKRGHIDLPYEVNVNFQKKADVVLCFSLENEVPSGGPLSLSPRAPAPLLPLPGATNSLRRKPSNFRRVALGSANGSAFGFESYISSTAPLASPTSVSAIYHPSPLANEWMSPTSPFSNTYKTPSSALVADIAVFSTSSTPCLPSSTPASPFFTPMPASPSMFTSPLMITAQVTDSPLIASSTFAAQSDVVDLKTSVPASTAASGAAHYQYSEGGPSTTLYEAVIATSVIGAVMCMGAFGLLAFLFLRRRHFWRKSEPLTISHPQLISRSSDSPDDDIEGKVDMLSEQRRSEVPTLPDPVLPSKLWKNGTAADAGVSEFRQSVEDGFGSLLQREGRSVVPDVPYTSATLSPRLDTIIVNEGIDWPKSASSRIPILPYRPQRFSSLPNIQAVQRTVESPPVSPSASFSSTDRESGHSSHTSLSVHNFKWQKSTERTTPSQIVGDRSSHTYTESASDDGWSVDNRPPSPTTSIRSKSSVRSSRSMKQALWALRKTAIIASASMEQNTGSANKAKDYLRYQPQTSYSSERSEVEKPGKGIAGSVDLSASLNMVLLDSETPSTALNSGKIVEAVKVRPVSQYGAPSRVSTRYRSKSLSAPKSRPATVGYAPPAILVTDHPQALVPPQSPKVKRSSAYSIASLPYC